MAPNQRSNNDSAVFGLITSILIGLPMIAWIMFDQSPFGGDQSQYAKATIDLYLAWQVDVTHWIRQLIHSMGVKPPGIVWIGEFFVPWANFIGSMDATLLLSIVLILIVAIFLLCRSFLILSQGNRLVALSGCLMFTLAPAYAFLSHQYLAESLQLLVVAWFILIMACAPLWPRGFILAQLLAASNLALLAKASSPLYCIVPGFVALFFALRPDASRQDWGWKNPATILTLILSIFLSAATTSWYFINIKEVMRYDVAFSMGPYAELWGKKDTFVNTYAYWLKTIYRYFFLTPVFLMSLSITVLGVISYVQKPSLCKQYFTICFMFSIFQVLLVLSVFSICSNREWRYLFALLPYFILVTIWGLTHIRLKFFQFLIFFILLCIWAINTTYNFKFMNPVFNRLRYVPFIDANWCLPRIDVNGNRKKMLEWIVEQTCKGSDIQKSYNIIAIDPNLKGDWLAPEPVNYLMSKKYLSHQSHSQCFYDYLGGTFFGNTAEVSWENLIQRQTRYIVTTDPAVYLPSEKALNLGLNQQNFPIFYKKLTSDDRVKFVAEAPYDNGILVFQIVNLSGGGPNLLGR
jgi:hypothetical protein